jgi:endonuclease/exonuclease/phosphatase family metal-dependent hydrolase
MKLVTLNIWGGHLYEPLLDFFEHNREVDIFCLQEVYCQANKPITDETRKLYLDIFSDIQAKLPQHQVFFRPTVSGVYGLGMLVKQSVEVVAEGELQIFSNPSYPGVGPRHSRILQWLECSEGGRHYTIINVHGLWNGKGKTDTAERLAQSKNIRAFLKTINTPIVLCGDFNLRPDTESLRMLSHDMVDLIKQHNIIDTRTTFYEKDERYADYIFTSPDVEVKKFSVLSDQVSDHAPLFLEVD